MDFLIGLPKTLRKIDSIWVAFERLTKLVYFIFIIVDYNVNMFKKNCVNELVHPHEMPLSIISNCGTQCTFKVWGNLHGGVRHTTHFWYNILPTN